MNYYPIFLDLRGRPCLVVGGGESATRKVDGLLGANADVTVISPEITDAIAEHARTKKLRHLKRRYQEGDLKGYFLAYAATGVAGSRCVDGCGSQYGRSSFQRRRPPRFMQFYNSGHCPP